MKPFLSYTSPAPQLINDWDVYLTLEESGIYDPWEWWDAESPQIIRPKVTNDSLFLLTVNVSMVPKSPGDGACVKKLSMQAISDQYPPKVIDDSEIPSEIPNIEESSIARIFTYGNNRLNLEYKPDPIKRFGEYHQGSGLFIFNSNILVKQNDFLYFRIFSTDPFSSFCIFNVSLVDVDQGSIYS